MGGSSRMHDPTEAEHDQRRRWWMNAAFGVIVLLNAAQVWFVGIRGLEWITALAVVIAAVPLGVTVKVFELRFKMSADERRQLLGGVPLRQQIAFAAYACLVIGVFALQAQLATWALVGIWVYDFVTYYHDRPERMRHLYAVMKTLDEIRDFPAPWAWPLPALIWEGVKHW